MSGVLSPYATDFVDTGLAANTLYSYWVRAFRGDPADQSRWAWAPGYVSANTYASPAGGLTPEYVSISAGTYFAYIEWDTTAGATIKRKQSGSSDWLDVGSVPPGQSSFYDFSVSQGTYYAYWVYSNNGEVARTYATVITAKANAPRAVSAAGQSSNSARIVFLDRSSNEVGHDIHRLINGVYWGLEVLLDPDVTSGTVTGLPASTQSAYWLKVRWGADSFTWDQGYIAADTFPP